jgi:hypothetical protein
MVTKPGIYSKLSLPANKEIDIKVLDNPLKIDDIKQKVIEFLKALNEFKRFIQIFSVDYAIICRDPSL